MKPITWWTIVRVSRQDLKSPDKTLDGITRLFQFPTKVVHGMVFTSKREAMEFIDLYGNDMMRAVKLSEIVREKS